MKLITTIILMVPVMALSQTQTIDFDNSDKWLSGSGGINSYQTDHSYRDSNFIAECSNCMRNTATVRDGEPGANGAYSWRIASDANEFWQATVPERGIDSFYVSLRRWNATGPIEGSIQYSLDFGSSWNFVDSISHGKLDNSSKFKTFSGYIHSDAPGIMIRVQLHGAHERFIVDDFTWTSYEEDYCFETYQKPVSICGTSYMLPSGKMEVTNSGTYFDTLEASTGCDSILEIELSLNDFPEVQAEIQHDLGSPKGEIKLTSLNGDLKYLWSTGAKSSSITDLSSGLYSVEITNLALCSSTYEYQIDNLAGIQNEELNPLKIYPIPFKSEFFIDNHRSELVHLQVLDISGRIIHSEVSQLDKIKINSTFWENGSYILQYQSQTYSGTQTLLKQ